LVNGAAAHGETVVDTWSGDLEIGPGPSRQLLAAVLRPDDARSDEIVIRNIARNKEVFRFRPAVDWLRFRGIRVLDLDDDGRQEIAGAFATPSIPSQGDVGPTVGPNKGWRTPDPRAPRPRKAAAAFASAARSTPW
jgi:hypothetical protein